LQALCKTYAIRGFSKHAREGEKQHVVDVIFPGFEHEKPVQTHGYARAARQARKHVAERVVDIRDGLAASASQGDQLLVFGPVVVLRDLRIAFLQIAVGKLDAVDI